MHRRIRHTRRKRKALSKKRKMLVGGDRPYKRLLARLPKNEGIGNQLFIIAMAMKVQKKTELPLYIIVSGNKYHSKLEYKHIYTYSDMNIFALTPAEGDVHFNKAKPTLKSIESKIRMNDQTVFWEDSDIIYDANDASDVKLPNYLYQNCRTVDKEIPNVKSMLLKNEFEKDDKKDLYEPVRKETKSDESAFVHVRVGDYVKSGWSQKLEYFIDGIKELDKNDTIKIIYLICNEHKWYTDNEAKLKEYTKKHIQYYNNENELVVLYKMMLCNAGAVISASTFSAWGAMMGANMHETSTIVYPKQWIKKLNWGDNPIMFPNRWIGIESRDIEGGTNKWDSKHEGHVSEIL